ncbi:hypothetical protein Vadar_033280 [Vaccinium darrowii]|uniref:Uncharacterized protein n=1 Tax=Vaccinium darrowii TaxID=229202 RepID=A0ACB7XWS8_9ERIC|nr:hypothetical protein Vadar_033280 [Vaccinium darrowii]
MSTSLNTRFESLTGVVFEQVYLTDEMISHMVSWCLNLERLKMRQCYGMKDVKICSPRLKSLELWEFRCDEGSVEICAPKFVEFDDVFL